MKVTHNQLFPLTMSVYTPDYKITEQEIEFLKNVEVATEEDMEQHVHLSKNIDILNTCPELKNIRDVMLDVAEQYKRDVFGISNELAPLHNWLSKQYEGGHHHKHNHRSVLFEHTPHSSLLPTLQLLILNLLVCDSTLQMIYYSMRIIK